jgi:N-acetylglucosaminyl-diphospho-decaprenol L-rhamnosyltransferase
MKIFISVVSHGHEKLIPELDCLSKLSLDDDVTVILKNNTALKDNSLFEYCKSNNIELLDEQYNLGFGENNNYIFDYAVKNLGLQGDDLFLVLNPDVFISHHCLISLVELFVLQKVELATINLFNDDKFSLPDNCVRSFPFFWDFLSSYIGLGNSTIVDKKIVVDSVNVDWAAGSFLLFKASLYDGLGGFDIGYFMYCEDIDICWRSQKLLNQPLKFFPNIKAVHYAQHENRKLFSKHFYWHVKSMFRYLLMHYSIRKPHINTSI